MNNILKKEIINNNYNIPKLIIQTYYNKDKIPKKVYNNIKEFANNYNHIIYDDNDCIHFLEEYYINIVVNKFKTLPKGAFKADLFRYCYLYINGGIYLDIKTELIKPLDSIFNNNYIYTVIAKNNTTIYQGVIATPPKKNIFLNLINNIINTPNLICLKNYLIFTKQFYNEIKKGKNIPKEGLNLCNNYNIYLFKEKCTNNPCDCYDKLDRYNLCCYIYDKFNNKIIKSRYYDFPF